MEEKKQRNLGEQIDALEKEKGAAVQQFFSELFDVIERHGGKVVYNWVYDRPNSIKIGPESSQNFEFWDVMSNLHKEQERRNPKPEPAPEPTPTFLERLWSWSKK